MGVSINYSSTISTSDPTVDGVVVVGKQEHLNQLRDQCPEVLQPKFGKVLNVQVNVNFNNIFLDGFFVGIIFFMASL